MTHHVDATETAPAARGDAPDAPALPASTPRWIAMLPVQEEQRRYASILAKGMYTGLTILLVTFALYVSGTLAPAVPVDALPRYWDLSIAEYLEVTNHNHLHHDQPVTGWRWLGALDHGDYLNFVGIAVLAGVTIVCFLGIIPTFLRRHAWLYAGMAALEVVILGLAASGILSVGH